MHLTPGSIGLADWREIYTGAPVRLVVHRDLVLKPWRGEGWQ